MLITVNQFDVWHCITILWGDKVICKRETSSDQLSIKAKSTLCSVFVCSSIYLFISWKLKVTQWTMNCSDTASLSACGLLIHFKPPPTFTEAGVHLVADQGRSCVLCCYCSMAGRHILAYFLFLLVARVIALLHALPIKHVNGALLNKSHRPTRACTIKWVSCLVVCWTR